MGPAGPNQVWQLDFSQFETTTGGTRRIAGCRDNYSKYELGWHTSSTANTYDAIAAVEAALVEAERLAGAPLVTLVTDNGGPFCSVCFEAGGTSRVRGIIAIHPELRHPRTRVRTPGQNGSQERGLGSLESERLLLEEVEHVLDLVANTQEYRISTTRSARTRRSPGTAPTSFTPASPTRWCPTFPSPKACQLLGARQEITPLQGCARGRAASWQG